MRSSRRLLFTTLVLPFFISCSFAEEQTVQQHLAQGNKFLISGQFNEAIISFNAAIGQDPSDYVSYYKRATAYLSLGRTNSAIQDFTQILNLKPGFEKALFQRAKLYVGEGNLILAKQDLLDHKDHSTNEEVKSLLASVEHAENESKLGQEAYENKQYEACIQHMAEVIRIVPQKPQWRLIRSNCHFEKGEIEEATSDLTRASQLNPSDKSLLIQLTNINFFSLYEPDRALSHIKQCIHYDPDEKQCKSLFRLVKKIEKDIKKALEHQQAQRYASALNLLIGTSTGGSGVVGDIDAPFDQLSKDMNINTLPKRLHFQVYSLACDLAAQHKDNDKATTWCKATLDIDPNHTQALAHLGEMKLNQNDFEGAVRDLEKAFEASGQQDRRIGQLLQRAQQLLRQSKKRDYYKILDVSRDADARTIKKAYRKMAHQWHPDKYTGDLDKNKVLDKMADINQAYEVLSDPEKKEQFDNGFDPYDPEAAASGHGHGGNPFGHHHGGNPFAHQFGGGSGGFHFGSGGGGGSHFSFQF